MKTSLTVLCCALFACVAASPATAGDVVGKVTVGYQGWFACRDDGSPIDIWWHWSPNAFQTPSPENIGIYSWPDVRQYARGFQTDYPALGNGQPALLFTSYDDQVVQTHFRWMQEYGIDTAALQRFNPFGGEGPTRNAMTRKVRTAAEHHGVKFYIMYDISGWTNFAAEIKADWTNFMLGELQITSSSAYAMEDGKPVVCIWGMGFDDRPGDAAACIEVIEWFQAQGCYVIGGVPTHWRNSTSDSKPDFLEVYLSFDMISPWMVGRFNDAAGSDHYRQNVNLPDIALCDANGIDYQPCVVPGHRWQTEESGGRMFGNYMWRQVANLITIGSDGLYVSMYDEYNEATQIIPTAENASMNPAGSDFITLDADGVACSSDFYLRLTGDAGRMLKGDIPFTYTRPTPPMPPTLVLQAPTGLVATAGNGEATLVWSPCDDADSYTVGRSTAKTGPYTVVASNVGLIGYRDAGLTNGTTYHYLVRAIRDGGESPDSAPVPATPSLPSVSASGENPPDESAAHAFDGLVTTKWYNGATGSTGWLRYQPGGSARVVTGYSLVSGNDIPSRDPRDWRLQGSNDGNTWSTLDTRTSQTFPGRRQTLSYTIANSAAFTHYQLEITANNGNANSIQLSELTLHYADGSGQPDTPQTLAATPELQAVQLSWDAVAGADFYHIKRSSNDGGPYVTIADSASNDFVDESPELRAPNFYVVSAAVDGAESAANSPQAGAIPLTALEAWRIEHFGSLDDPESALDLDVELDGRRNLVEYAVGSDPHVIDLLPPFLVEHTPDGDQLTISFTRIADPDLTYSVEATDDLAQNWTTIWSSTGPSNASGPVTVTDPQSLAEEPARFLRLIVSDDISD